MSESDQLMPLVSVVIPCYNHQEYVQKCIKSIIEQDYKNIELIVIDDGSSDDSVNKIQELIPECMIRFRRFEFRARPNKGLCATLNEAIAWCEGEFYSAIASDDMMLPEKTSTQVLHFKKHPECDAVFGGMYIIDDCGIVKKTKRGVSGFVNFNDLFVMKKFLAAPTQMIRLQKLISVGPYPEGLYIEDWYMWLRLCHSGSVVFSLAKPLVYYRRHEGNMSGKIDAMIASRKAIILNYTYHPKYKKAKAACLLAEAIDLQKYLKKRSFNAFLYALRLNPFIFLEKRSIYYLVKFLIY